MFERDQNDRKTTNLLFFSLREKTKESKILELEHSELFAAKYYKTEKHLLAKRPGLSDNWKTRNAKKSEKRKIWSKNDLILSD